MAPHILNLDARWRWTASFTHQPGMNPIPIG